MNKNLLLFGIAAVSVFANAAEPYINDFGKNVRVTNMSANGKYIVGPKWGYEETDILNSYIYNTETDELTWLTNYTTDAIEKSGCFINVNDNGTVVGYYKDPANGYVIDWGGGDFAPSKESPFDNPDYGVFNTAAIWRNGEVISLGLGNLDKEKLTDFTDGTIATAISADEKLVAGYTQLVWMPAKPVGWKLNETSGDYDFFEYTLPKGSPAGCINDVSSDGSMAGGYVIITGAYGGEWHPAIWKSQTECILLEPDETVDDMHGSVIAFSDNGKYALVSFDAITVGVYEIESGKFKQIEIDSNIFEVQAWDIANNGDVIAKAMRTDYTDVAMYYSYIDNSFYNLEYYASLHCGDLELPDFTQYDVKFISADATKIVGSNDMEGKAWLLQFDGSTLLLPPTLKSLTGFVSGLDAVTLKWSNSDEIPENLTLKAYNIYCDGQLVETIGADALQGTTPPYRHTVKGLEPGNRVFKVTAIYDSEKGEIAAPESTIVIKVYDDCGLPFFESFDSLETIDFNQLDWTRDYVKKDILEIADWVPCQPDYENLTCFAGCTIITQYPYEANMVSKMLDASGLDNLRLTFYLKLQAVNRDDFDYTHEDLFIECSTDGENWETIQTYNAAEIPLYAWNFRNIKLPKSVEGKAFKIRFSARGEGIAQLRWNVDYVSIATEDSSEAAPRGIAGSMNDNNILDLKWKNHFNAYELNYLANTGRITDQCIGNNGEPIIAAISLGEDMLKNYNGQYISSVSAFIFDGLYVEENPTKADVVIYENGKLICQQAFECDNFAIPHITTQALSNPVKIDATKEYKVGVRIHDYDPSITPVYYSTQNAKRGVTDLFSEDEGKTWEYIYDIYDPESEYFKEYGNCVWNITANVTATPETEIIEPEYPKFIVGYNVYRNGEQINDKTVYANYLKYTDKDADPNALYTIRAFYSTGEISAMSEPLCPASVSDISLPGIVIYPNPVSDILNISGEFDKAEIFNVNGMLVMSTTQKRINVTGLQKGLYIVRILKGDKMNNAKIVIR